MDKQAPIIAFLYDFDKTLCTTDMEDYAFIPSLGYTPAEFWGKANAFGWENRMDGLLAYMYTMIQECAAQGIQLNRAFLNRCGQSIQLFPGVRDQFVYRINKGILDVSRDKELNDSMPDNSKRIPFTNMIYIGDGLSDVPCMKMMRAYGGQAIAVYQSTNRQGVEKLLGDGRVDFIFPADYRADTELDRTVRDILRKMTITDRLLEANTRQLRSIGKSELPDQVGLF